jgi:serine/threonine protein kinase
MPDYLDAIINKAIAKNPADRFQSVGELLEELHAV